MVAQGDSHKLSLGSDRPKQRPDEDEFGYSWFAERLANAVLSTPSPEGLVIGLNGSWGCGKSTILNFVKHNLSQALKEKSLVLIHFNPWWFSNCEQLATQFLLQFSNDVPTESEVLLNLGDSLAKYSKEISVTVAASTSSPWLSFPLKAGLKFLKRKEKTIPQRKAEISNALQAIGKKFLFVIDDVDR